MPFENFAPKKNAATVVPIMPIKKIEREPERAPRFLKPVTHRDQKETERTALNQSGAGMRLPICGMKM